MKKKKVIKTTDYPVPEEFISTMRTVIGDEAVSSLVTALEEQPCTSVRLNLAKCTHNIKELFPDQETSQVPWCDSGFYIEPRPDFSHDPLFHAGVYYVQEAASMVYQEILTQILKDFSPSPLRILDLCSAPGGKATAILNALVKTGITNYTLVANEYDRKRAVILTENLQKWGDPNVIITNSDPASFTDCGPIFDIVSVDAPCSGEGMMRREPVARKQWSKNLINHCSALQKKIIDDILPVLKPGGFLIYSTCTFNHEENEGVIENLLKSGEFTMVSPHRRFMPHEVKCEGLCVAVLRKNGESLTSEPPLHTSKKKRKTLQIPDNVSFLEGDDLSFIEIKDNIYAFPGRIENLYNYLKSKSINIMAAGVPVGNIKGDAVIPSSIQVLSSLFKADSLPHIEIDRDTAISYLSRNSLTLSQDIPLGFVVVTYKNYPLGLVKNIGNRANNLYPSYWKL